MAVLFAHLSHSLNIGESPLQPLHSEKHVFTTIMSNSISSNISGTLDIKVVAHKAGSCALHSYVSRVVAQQDQSWGKPWIRRKSVIWRKVSFHVVVFEIPILFGLCFIPVMG